MIPPGEIIGGYEIEEYRTEGGWAHLYRARRTTNNKQFAFKTIRFHFADDPEYRRLFKREQEILDALDPPHQNICIAQDWSGGDSDLLWLAVPWVTGRTLRSRIAEGPLDEETAVRVIAEAADGLHSVHTAEPGLIHNDLHPANLMIDARGRARVIDFGLAKRFEHSSGSPFLQRKGRWNSPEALQGKDLDPRADIYSLGLLLAFALTGAEPEPGYLTLPENFNVPSRLRGVIAEATAGEPDERLSSAAEMAAALRRSPSQPRVSAPEAKPEARPAPRIRERAEPTRKQRSAAARAEPRTVSGRPILLTAALAAAITFLLIALFPAGDEPNDGLRIGTAQASTILPEGWAPIQVPAADRKLGMTDAARGPSAVVLLGSVRRSQLPRTAPGDDAFNVSLPAGHALRIDQPAQAGLTRMYAIRSGNRVVVLGCRPAGDRPRAATEQACKEAAESLKVSGTTGPIRQPSTTLRKQAETALHRYSAARDNGVGEIDAAETAAAAGAGAAGIAKASAKAAKRAAAKPLRPLRVALQRAARAWRNAAAAARNENDNAYAKAGTAVKRAENRIRQARQRLVELGYRP